jgi:two-component system chemotaxis response regulator CheY
MSEKQVQMALVADPSSHMAALAATMLRTLGYRTVEVTLSLPETAAALGKRPFGVVLLDEQLGGPEGYEVVRALRHNLTHPNRMTPIIMMAAAPDTAMIAAARDAGVSEFLRKPFSAEHIRSRLVTLRTRPREFVEAGDYAGPDRRRRGPAEAAPRRRAADRGAS